MKLHNTKQGAQQNGNARHGTLMNDNFIWKANIKTIELVICKECTNRWCRCQRFCI